MGALQQPQALLLAEPRAPGCCLGFHGWPPDPPGLRLQGFATAKQRPTMQRVVAAVRAADQGPERLHDSFEKGDYDSPYKGGR